MAVRVNCYFCGKSLIRRNDLKSQLGCFEHPTVKGRVWHWVANDGTIAEILIQVNLNGKGYGIALRPDIGMANIEIYEANGGGWETISLPCFPTDLTPENAVGKLETWLNFL